MTYKQFTVYIFLWMGGIILELVLHHGTSKEIKKIIQKKGFEILNFFECIEKNKTQKFYNYPWLGEGAYFYDNDNAQAKQWAYLRFGFQKAVVTCLLEVEDSEVLDLDKRNPFLKFKKVYDYYREKNIDYLGHVYDFSEHSELLFIGLVLTKCFPDTVIKKTFRIQDQRNVEYQYTVASGDISVGELFMASCQVCIKGKQISLLRMG